MKELLKVSQNRIGDDKVNSVSARELHVVLGVSKDFSSWIKAQLNRGFFVENIDYIVVPIGKSLHPQKGEQRGGHNKIDYILTLETAKHISMMSGTQKGKEVRDYFIEVEKRFWQVSETNVSLKDLDLQSVETDLETVSRILKIFQEHNSLEKTQLDNFINAKFGVSLLQSFKISFQNTLFLPTELGKFIGVSGAEMNRKLKEKGFQIRDGKHWKLTEKGVEFGNDVSEEFPQLKWKIDVLL
jgi:phage anti-repressor protein